jgi:anti-sigma factor (TIGR02949 family)
MHAWVEVTCEESFRQLDPAIDGELSEAELARIRQHREQCPACAAEHRFEAALDRHIRARLQEVSLPERLRAQIHAMLAVEARLQG